MTHAPADAPATPIQFERLPAETPLDMPVQSFAEGETAPPSPPGWAWRRFVVFASAGLFAAAAYWASYVMFAKDGWTRLEVVGMALFAPLFFSISCWFCSAVAGLITLLRKRPEIAPDDAPPPAIHTRNAILMPIYNEDADAVFDKLEAIDRSLAQCRIAHLFDVFVLSDTKDEEIAARERAHFERLEARAAAKFYYRRRENQYHRKAGNLAEWVRRFGAAYENMVVLDADSLMRGETIQRLVAFMERHPRAGMVQTVPVIINAETMFGRYLQFGVRMYGQVAAAGLAWWTGSEGSYWGHNAIVRVRAFAAAAGLPVLTGPRPFGGHILSHDVVEGVLLRRAGWEVHIDARLSGSYEEAPPTIIDFIARDRRWCQGNFQHVQVLKAKGLHWVSRAHLFMGVQSYLVSPLWFGFLAIGIAQNFEYGMPAGWDGFKLFGDEQPANPAMVTLTALTVVLLFGPKLFGALLVMLDKAERKRFGGGGAVVRGMLGEMLVSALLAPVMMLMQTRALYEIAAGRDCGWLPQNRTAVAVGWADAFKFSGFQFWIGIAMAAGFAPYPGLLIWTAPLWIGLIAIPLLTVLSSRRELADAARAQGVWLTPEEAANGEARRWTEAEPDWTLRPARDAV